MEMYQKAPPPESSDEFETYIEQEAIRLLSLAIDAAVGQLLQEQNPLANSELEITVLPVPVGEEAECADREKITLGAESIVGTKTLQGKPNQKVKCVQGNQKAECVQGNQMAKHGKTTSGTKCLQRKPTLGAEQITDIEAYLKLEAEKFYYSELCTPDVKNVNPKPCELNEGTETGSGECTQYYAAIPSSLAADFGNYDSNSLKTQPIRSDWANAKEFTPRKPPAPTASEPSNAAGPGECENNTGSASEKHDKYYNNNNCLDRTVCATTCLDQGQTAISQAHPHYNYTEATDVSAEDNSQADVLDIIVLPDSGNSEKVQGTQPGSSNSSVTSANLTSICDTKPTTYTQPPPPPPAVPCLPKAPFYPPAASRVPISMILPARPPCRPPINIPNPSLRPINHSPFIMSQSQPSYMPPNNHFNCPPPQYLLTDNRPFYPPAVHCFYPPDSPPPGVQYGYPQRGKRRKAQRLSSRFPTQAGKFHHHANFYVKSCAESVVTNRPTGMNNTNLASSRLTVQPTHRHRQ